MKSRLRVVLLSLTAVLAVGSMQAIAATAASAAQPRFEERLTQNFQFGGEVATFATATQSVQCKTLTGAPEISGFSSLGGPLKFHNCTWTFDGIPAGTCTSTGAASGEIVTAFLQENLVYLSATKHEVGMLFTPPKAGAAFASFKCAGNEEELRGSVLSRATPVNTRVTSFQLAAKGSKGIQELTTYEGSKGEKLSSGLELSYTKGPFEQADLNAAGLELHASVQTEIIG